MTCLEHFRSSFNNTPRSEIPIQPSLFQFDSTKNILSLWGYFLGGNTNDIGANMEASFFTLFSAYILYTLQSSSGLCKVKIKLLMS